MIKTKFNNTSGRKKVHGHSSLNKDKSTTPTYNTWRSMRLRCSNEKHISYSKYGGSGISVCDRWNNFNNFLDDMGIRPIGKTLDRINNKGDYYKENCRWSSLSDQQNNKSNNVNITINGETLSVTRWAEKLKIDKHLIFNRIKRGWNPEKAILTNKRKYN